MDDGSEAKGAQRSAFCFFTPQVLALSLFVLVPLAYGGFTHDPTRIKGLLAALVAGIIFLKMLAGKMPFGIARERPAPCDLALILFLLLNGASLAARPMETSVVFISEELLLIFLFYVYAALARRTSFDIFARINGVALLGALLIGLVQILSHRAKPISTFGNPNYFGGYLAALWPILLFLCRDRNRLFRGLAISGLLLFFVNATFIRSWAMALSLGLSLFFLIHLYGRSLRERVIALSLYGLFLVFFFQIPAVQTSFVNQVLRDIRPLIWSGVFRLIGDYPLLGCGAGRFWMFYPAYRDPVYFTHPLSVDNTDHAHCELLELWSEIGLLGLLSFGLFLGLVVWNVVKTALQRDRAFQLRIFSVLLGAFLLFFENLFDVNLRYMSSKFIFWSFLGWAYGMATSPAAPPTVGGRAGPNDARRMSWVKPLAALLWIFFLYHGFVKPYIGDYFFRRGIKERWALHYDEAIKNYQKAVWIFPESVEAHYRLAFLYGSLGRNPEAVRAYQSVIRLAPHFASVHGNLGTIYSRMGNLREAYRHLSLQVRLNPYDPKRLSSLASALLRMGRVKEAKIFLRRAHMRDPDQKFARDVLRRLRAS